MASKNSIKLFVGAGLMLAACGAFAAVSQTFTGTAGAAVSTVTAEGAGTWVGDGTLVSVSSAPTSTAGKPVEDAGTIVLSVEGEVACTNTTGGAAASSQADFLINIVDPSEELPNAEELGTLQIAVAAGTTVDSSGLVPLVVFCKPNTGSGVGSAAWTNVTTVATGSWHRVTLAFDYASGLCRLSLDGVPVVSDAGFLSTNVTDTAGSWYKLVDNGSTDKVESLTFRGVASVDDVVISESIAENFTGNKSVTVDGVAVNVSYNDLNKWGIDGTDLTLQLDDSGLTVAAKLECGLDPLDGSKFEAVAMTLGNNGASATFTLPEGINTANSTYTVYYSTTPNGAGTALNTTREGEVLTATGIPTDAAVLYFTIKATATAHN